MEINRNNHENVRKSINGKYRMINSDLLQRIYDSNLNASEIRILLYIIWNISSSTTRNYCDIKIKTLSEKINMNKKTCYKYTKTLVEKQVIFKLKDNRYGINFNYWFLNSNHTEQPPIFHIDEGVLQDQEEALLEELKIM